MDKFVYADNAGTTGVSPEVLESMMPYLTEQYGNPSSLHQKGREAKRALDDARMRIAEALDCKTNELYFTSGGSEALNWAIKGVSRAYASKGKHIITTKIEHHAVLHAMKSLEKEGFEVTYLDVDKAGYVSPESVEKALKPDTTLVCVMYANNEIGTIEPISEIAKLAKANGSIMLTDAVQAVGHIPVNIASLNVDMLVLSGHKFNAPKGVGALYIRNGVRVENLIDGGGQERNKRGGTENIAQIVGMAKALEIAVSRLDETDRVEKMRDRLIDEILKIPNCILNGGRTRRLPGNVNVAFEYIEGESLLLMLDMAGICASTGSACSSASLEPSHVLLATGLPVEIAHGSLRLTINHENTSADIDYILEKLPPIVQRLRDMSPLYNKEDASQ